MRKVERFSWRSTLYFYGKLMISTTKTSTYHTVLNMIIFIIGMIVLGSSIVGCLTKAVDKHEGEKKMQAKTIEVVLEEHTDKWMSIPGVVGTAIGEYKGKPCIKIFVVKKTAELTKKIPSKIEGFPVVIQETGEFRALD